MVEPNTVVQVGPGVTIEIRGRILSQGTDSGRIQFVLSPGQSDFWNGIHLEGTIEENILSYVDISGAESMDGSIGPTLDRAQHFVRREKAVDLYDRFFSASAILLLSGSVWTGRNARTG